MFDAFGFLGIVISATLIAIITILLFQQSRPELALPGIPLLVFSQALSFGLVALFMITGIPEALRPYEVAMFGLAGLSSDWQFVAYLVRVARESAFSLLPLMLLIWFASRLNAIDAASMYLAAVLVFTLFAICSVFATLVTTKLNSRLSIPFFGFASVALGYIAVRISFVGLSVPAWSLVLLFAFCEVLLALIVIKMVQNRHALIEMTPKKRATFSGNENGREFAGFTAIFARLWLNIVVLLRSRQYQVNVAIASLATVAISYLLRNINGSVGIVVLIAVIAAIAGYARSEAIAMIGSPIWLIGSRVSTWTIAETVIGSSTVYYASSIIGILVLAAGKFDLWSEIFAIVLAIGVVSTARELRFSLSWALGLVSPSFGLPDVLVGTVCGTLASLPLLLFDGTADMLLLAAGVSIVCTLLAAVISRFALFRGSFP